MGRHSSFGYRFIFANLWFFKPFLAAYFGQKGGELNAMLRTTCAFTMMEGSNASNVLPPVAKMTANLRLLEGDTPESARERLQSIASAVSQGAIQVREVYSAEPTTVSKTTGPEWEALKSAVLQTWPEAIVSPYMLFACTDSRHYHRISDHVYRFSPMKMSKEERALLHSHNERISVQALEETVAFYTRLLRKI
jgi:carboxypeptidase PM20D1